MRSVERPSTLAFGAAVVLVGGICLAAIHTWIHRGTTNALEEARQLASALDLTDLALFNEARYTRNPSQADLHSAFQDGPLTLEHFPTGSLVGPPLERDASATTGR